MADDQFSLTSTATAIALVLPADKAKNVQTLRSVHDKAYRKWPPHINILYPFVAPEQLAQALARIREALNSRPYPQHLPLRTNRIGKFLHRKNATVFLQPDETSEAAISSLRKIMVQALGLSERAGTRDGVFRSHMTIGQAALTGNALQRLMDQVEACKDLEWENRSLAVLRRKPDSEMEIVDYIALVQQAESAIIMPDNDAKDDSKQSSA